MTNPAITDDIAARWRPLTSAELIVAQTRLDDAWRKLKRELSDLETRMAGNADLTADTVRVLSDAVIRLLQNLDRRGLKKGSLQIDDGSTSWEADDYARADLYFTEGELADLSGGIARPRARAFSVTPS